MNWTASASLIVAFAQDVTIKLSTERQNIAMILMGHLDKS
jgi:hypothetical protein